MVKITLNKAIKLRNSLNNLKTPIRHKHQVNLDSEISSSYKNVQEMAIKSSEREEGRINAIFQLRDIISSANYVSGASSVINDMARINQLLSSYNNIDFVDGYDLTGSQALTADEAIDEYDYQVRYAESKGEPYRVRKVFLKSALAESEAKEKIRLWKIELGKKEEKRNEINHRTTVEIPDDLVIYLKGVDLI